jgi:hypothetical protein
MTRARAAKIAGAVVAVLAEPLAAQASQRSVEPHQHAIALSVDAGSFPDAFSTRCGTRTSGGAGFGGGIGVITRLRHHVIVAEEIRASYMPDVFGCDLPLLAVRLDSNVYETRPGYTYPPGTPSLPLLRTLMRFGIEGPDDGPLFHATVGAGVIWSGHPAPLGALAIGVGSRGPGARFYVELERDVSRVVGTEARERFRGDSTGTTSLGIAEFRRAIYPTWTTLHLGLELPAGRSPRRE